jgi:hypothetical protein
MRAHILIVVAAWCMAGCIEGTTEDPTDPTDPDPTNCDPSAVLDRVWEFSSNNTFFFLRLDADGSYRRETDAPPATVLCEFGQWRASECGTIEFQTCRGTVERRAWAATSSTLELDQSTYHASSLDAETAFSFCDPTECD